MESTSEMGPGLLVASSSFSTAGSFHPNWDMRHDENELEIGNSVRQGTERVKEVQRWHVFMEYWDLLWPLVHLRVTLLVCLPVLQACASVL